MDTITSSPGAQRLFTASIIARLPLAMLSIGLLVHARQLTGSFALAGVVTGAYAIALGAGGPLLGHLIDRRGQTSVLLASASIAAALLVTIALLPARAPLAVLVALAAGIGLAAPPVGACLRAQLPALLSDPGAISSAYALEASLVELTYIFGPPLALCIGALWSSGAALAAAGLVLLAATAAFAVQPASRSWQSAPADRTSRGGSLRVPAMRTLVIVLFAVGMLLGAGEVAVIAAAKALHTTMGGAPLFAVWGAGSFIGGLLLARLGGGARTAAGLALLLGALTAGHLALIPADGNVLALGAVLLVAGAAIAPTEATLYAMVGNAAPDGTITEAFAWLATAMAVGNAAGAAGAGIVADRAGPAAAFALAGAAGALALLTSMLRSRTMGASTSPSRKPAAPIAAGSPAAGKARTGRRGDCSRPEQVTEGARRAGQVPDVDSRIAATVVHRAVEAVPLLLRDRPDAGLTHRARELAGFFGAAFICTGTDAASS
jgi:predicted MFS family arabinose efflux permease